MEKSNIVKENIDETGSTVQLVKPKILLLLVECFLFTQALIANFLQLKKVKGSHKKVC